MSSAPRRTATVARKTAETDVELTLSLDGGGRGEIRVGIPFFEHLLDAWTRHAGVNLALRCEGDLQVDDHHSVEDVALVLGQALAEALGDKRGVRRFGHAYVPLDEALVRCVVDLSGRPFAHVEIPLRREAIGGMSMENVPHFFRSLANSAALTLHLEVLRGENDHHVAEAAFKAFAVALRDAVSLRTGSDEIPSTKESL